MLPSFSFSDLKKNPFPAFLIIVCVAVGYLFSQFTGTSKDRMDDCQRQNVILQERLDKKDSMLQDLQNKLIFKDEIIKQVKPVADSMVRTPTEDRVNNLLNKK